MCLKTILKIVSLHYFVLLFGMDIEITTHVWKILFYPLDFLPNEIIDVSVYTLKYIKTVKMTRN